MALSDVFTNEAWPVEGRTLGEIVKRLVGPEAWQHLTAITAERAAPWLGYFRITDRADVLAQYGDSHVAAAVRDCLPLLDAWNSGAIIAKARESAFGSLVDIPSPVTTGYILTIDNFEYSRIVDPSSIPQRMYSADELWQRPAFTVRRFYDLRFWPREVNEVADEMQSETVQTAIRSNKAWYAWAVKNVPADRDLREYGAKKAHAQKLAARMKFDARTNKSIKPRSAKTIAARFNADDLWPKKTTK